MQPPYSGWLIDTFTLSYSPRPRMPMQERMHPHAISPSTSRTNARTLTREVGDVSSLMSRLVRHAESCPLWGQPGAVCLLRSFIL